MTSNAGNRKMTAVPSELVREERRLRHGVDVTPTRASDLDRLTGRHRPAEARRALRETMGDTRLSGGHEGLSTDQGCSGIHQPGASGRWPVAGHRMPDSPARSQSSTPDVFGPLPRALPETDRRARPGATTPGRHHPGSPASTARHILAGRERIGSRTGADEPQPRRDPAETRTGLIHRFVPPSTTCAGSVNAL